MQGKDNARQGKRKKESETKEKKMANGKETWRAERKGLTQTEPKRKDKLMEQQETKQKERKRKKET